MSCYVSTYVSCELSLSQVAEFAKRNMQSIALCPRTSSSTRHCMHCCMFMCGQCASDECQMLQRLQHLADLVP